MHLGTFTQPCAERSKSLVEQSEEITVESLLKNNDIQPLENKSRFLVAPRKREHHESDALFFLLIRDGTLLGVVIEGSPNKIVASDSIKKDLESFMTCVSKSFLSQMYDRFGFIVVFSLLFVQILTPLYY